MICAFFVLLAFCIIPENCRNGWAVSRGTYNPTSQFPVIGWRESSVRLVGHCPRLWSATTFYIAKSSSRRRKSTCLPNPKGAIGRWHAAPGLLPPTREVLSPIVNTGSACCSPHRSQHEIQVQAEDPNIIYEVSDCLDGPTERGSTAWLSGLIKRPIIGFVLDHGIAYPRHLGSDGCQCFTL